MIRISIFILSFLGVISISCQSLEIQSVEVNGTVFFHFEKDTTSDAYYFTRNYITADNQVMYDLMNNYTRAEDILNLCGDKYGMLLTAIKQRDKSYALVESGLFQDKILFGSGIHYGGEIFNVSNDESHLVVAFNVHLFGTLILNVCPAVNHPFFKKDVHCPFVINNLPIILVTNIVKVESINETLMTTYSLSRSKLKQFQVIYCE